MNIVIAGLGNIGVEYRNTRHNVGFMVVERLVEYYNFSWQTKSKFHTELAEGSTEGHKLLIAKPMTYMNLSGKALQAICNYYNIDKSNVFVIHDDIDLPLGKIKYKLGGGNGGHNGLKSIDQCLGNNYHRIRIGIGRPAEYNDVSDYVLSSFSKEEYKIIVNSIEVIINNFRLLLLGEVGEFKRRII